MCIYIWWTVYNVETFKFVGQRIWLFHIFGTADIHNQFIWKKWILVNITNWDSNYIYSIYLSVKLHFSFMIQLSISSRGFIRCSPSNYTTAKLNRMFSQCNTSMKRVEQKSDVDVTLKEELCGIYVWLFRDRFNHIMTSPTASVTFVPLCSA